MSLYTFNRTGLLTKETTFLLKNLDSETNWEKAKQKLYTSGFIPTENRNEELFREIKKRFMQKQTCLPNIKIISAFAHSRINPISKAEVYFAYLFYSDKILSDILKQIFEIYDQDKKNLIITRETIVTLLEIYLKKNKIMQTEKTIQNWIGKFISTLKEIRLLLSKRKSTYIINIGGQSVETWTFFLMDAYFNKYSYQEALFKEAFHILPQVIPDLIQRSNIFDWNIYSITSDNNSGITFDYEPQYNSILDWLSEFDD